VTIIVTGATGFVGSALIRNLALTGARVIALAGPRFKQVADTANVEWLKHQGDVEEFSRLVAEISPTTVVHCASHYVLRNTIKDIDPMIDANIRVGTVLLQTLAKQGVHFVNLSSFFQKQGNDGQLPNSLYATTKQAFADIVRWFGVNSRIRTCDLLLFDTYGPGDQRRKLIPELLSCAATGGTLDVQSPSAEMNLCYITDVTAAIVQVINQETTGVWSIRAEFNTKVSDVVAEIESITGRRIVGQFGYAAPHALPRLDGPKVLAGWKPKTNLRDGLTKCWHQLH